VNRRQLLTGIGAAAAVGAVRPYSGAWFESLHAQGAPPDWPARIAALPRPAAGEIVVTAVGDMIISNPATGRPGPDVQQMYRVLRESDAAFGNCEEPIASVGFMYQKTSQMAWPPILDDFKTAGFNMLSGANNHYMDLGPEGLLQGLKESRSRGFTMAGAGSNLDEALAPGIRTVKGVRVGLLAFWCNQAAGGYCEYDPKSGKYSLSPEQALALTDETSPAFVGGGFFVRFSALPARLAWEAFQEKNGVADYAVLKRRVEQYRGPVKGDPEIGCNVLNRPFFFERGSWIAIPESWAPNIVRGRTFDTTENDGLRLWNAVNDRLRDVGTTTVGAEEPARFGAEYLTRARLGQGAFNGAALLNPFVLFGFFIVGGFLRTVLGRLIGASATGVVVALVVWLIAGSIAAALLAGGLAFVVAMFADGFTPTGPGSRSRNGGWSSSGSSRDSDSGFSGGGGSFGGGGASGSW